MFGETRSRQRAVILPLAAAYFFLAWLVFSTIAENSASAPIWPSAGLAVVALLRFGNPLWPGVFLGSLGFNCWLAWHNDQFAALAGMAGLIAAGQALGATLQALLAAKLTRRFVSLPNNFDGQIDIAKFFLGAGPLGCLVDATSSATLQWYTGALRANGYLASWVAWWLRDTVGCLIILPVLVVCLTEKRVIDWRRAFSVATPVVVLATILCWVFDYARDWQTNLRRLEFDRQAASIGDSLQQSLDSQLALLRTMASFYANADDVSRKDFADFVRTLIKDNRALQGIEWVPRITGP